MLVVKTLTDDEVDALIYYREFKEWYAALSAPARRTLAQLPADTRLSIVNRLIARRLNNEIVQGVRFARPDFTDQRPLLAA